METQALSIANVQSKSSGDFTRLLICKFRQVQLFCFARSGTPKEDSGCSTRKDSSTNSHYRLLMVTKSEVRIEQAFQKLINLFIRGQPS